MKHNPILLGVNIDHVATVRQARGTDYPDPVQAALQAEKAGATGITLHLREDRRHIQPEDVRALKKVLTVPMNLEMAITPSMLAFAQDVKPEHVCLVPEKREELTTEGGLDIVAQFDAVRDACQILAAAGMQVSLFIDPDTAQIDGAKAAGAPVIELHTGCYADATTQAMQQTELARIQAAARYAAQQGLIVNAGHGLHYENVQPIAHIPYINELNIGHSIVAKALSVGLFEAVREMKRLMDTARDVKAASSGV